MLNGLLAICLILVIIDAIWINFVTGPIFNRMVKEIQGKEININMVGAFFSYACLAIGIYWFGYRNINSDNVWESALPAALFGVVGYGLFDFTNMAIFDKWEVMPTIIDVAWGGAVCYATAIGAHMIYPNDS
mgnify:CR=1 FL=1